MPVYPSPSPPQEEKEEKEEERREPSPASGALGGSVGGALVRMGQGEACLGERPRG